MRFLDENMRGRLGFDEGVAVDDQFRFESRSQDRHTIAGEFTRVSRYSATRSRDTLRIEGSSGAAQPICCDIPLGRMHREVTATLLYSVTRRENEAEVCWNTAQNTIYRVQYRATLAADVAWLDLGPPVAGDGSPTCRSDVAAVQPERLYRVSTLP
jgi:hypothetical protein